MQIRGVHVMVGMLASGLLGSTAQAEEDPFAMLRVRERGWTFELVTGPTLDALTAVKDVPHTRCQVAEVTDDGVQSARIECAALATPGAEVAAALAQHFTLVFDASGVREAVDDDPAQLAERSNAGAFTFPRKLVRRWTHDVRRADGVRGTVLVHDEPAVIRGGLTSLWIAESSYRGRARDAAPPVYAVAAFAPGIGPTLKCTVGREPGATKYSCLRLVDEPTGGAKARPKPAPAVTIAGRAAQDKSSLTAAAVAGKINAAYLSAIRRCYTEVLRKKPGLRGSLQLDFTVNAVGKLSEPRAKTAEDTLASCVTAAMAGWQFAIPQSEYGEPRNARFVITLRLTP